MQQRLFKFKRSSKNASFFPLDLKDGSSESLQAEREIFILVNMADKVGGRAGEDHNFK